MQSSTLRSGEGTIIPLVDESTVCLPVSLGEALDKYSILQIKELEIKDSNRVKDVKTEMIAILPGIESIMKRFSYQYKCLYLINKEIWDLSAMVRDPNISTETKNSLFLETFYKNDARFRIKSKLNKLNDSKLREQKSYSSSKIRIKISNDISQYNNRNSYIRYLSLCYDIVIIECNDETEEFVARMFRDDPHIIISSTLEGDDTPSISLDDDSQEPIANLYKKYNFNYIAPLNYVIGGRLGDFLHLLYVVMCKYETTGAKGHIYMTNDPKWGGDHFGQNYIQTYNELYDIVMDQPYIESFSILTNQQVNFDLNLNDFRRSPVAFKSQWFELLSKTFNHPIIKKPWIQLSDRYYDPKYKDMVLVHRVPHSYRHIPQFIPILSQILKSNRCLFITCNEQEYSEFPLSNMVSMEKVSTIGDMFTAINSCKFFIGNQSSPLVLAVSLYKPALAELVAPEFYVFTETYYDPFYWVSQTANRLQGINKYLSLTGTVSDNMTTQTLNYICGGRLGDFIHALYVIKCKHETTGKKGNLYITDHRGWGGDGFACDIKRTYEELYDIVIEQPYIESFSLYLGQNIRFDINLNAFRKYPGLNVDSWLEIMSNTFGVKLIEKPWITMPDTWVDPKYKDVVIIHRSSNYYRYVPGFINILEPIVRRNKCLFVTCSKEEYDLFPLKYFVPLELKSTLKEMYIAINSCKFFIGNQSSLLTFAYSLFKPALCESKDGGFYSHKKHYEGFNWFNGINNRLDDMDQYINNKPDETDLSIVAAMGNVHVGVINHAVARCGVYQYAKRLAQILTGSDNAKITFTYHEISTLQEYQTLCSQSSFNAIIYNYHSATLPWLNNMTIQRVVPNIAIFHEGGVFILFDHIIDIGGNDRVDSIPRPLLESNINLSPYVPNVEEPIIGSFGFGFAFKGFPKLVEYVNDQFDRATIRLHITFSYYGDDNGSLSKLLAQTCDSLPRKEGIKLIITHDFVDDVQLLDFLNGNTINIFLYDDLPGRGYSSVIDHALSVNRPIGISNSYMFRHIYSDQICVYKTPIKDIIINGLNYINPFKEKWSNKQLVGKLETYLLGLPSIRRNQITTMINNTVLTDEYRALLAPDISELFRLVPSIMARKFARANVQQAFVFKYIRDNFTPDVSMICVGSHEDTCCAGLKELGHKITEIDSLHNYDLHTYCVNNMYPQFDVVFAISVVQQVQNDAIFVDDMCKLLKPNGTCVLTCDFNDAYKPGDRMPAGCLRFYTKTDLLERFGKVLDQNNCYIDGDVDYSASPDFIYEDVLYAFGTLIFKKKNP